MKKVIYLAGGCFWGMEHLFQGIKGVISTMPGYANGSSQEEANYKTVCTGTTGFKETVRVEYDDEVVSLDLLLLTYFYVINPEQKNRQANDIGTQYQTGIYYIDEESKEIIDRIYELEKSRHTKFFVEKAPLVNFFDAEEYHQKYLDKNPDGYCHIPFEEMRIFKNLKIDPSEYKKPSREIIQEKLNEEQFRVTQEAGTEYPYTNEYWNKFEKGIYVDIVTGEPLFSSLDKYQSECGWPSFTKPIEEPSIIKLEDYSHNMFRTEVRSRTGNTHLGHVFEGDTESPNGVRYCINSASIKFIPYEKMEELGYGYLLDIFKK